MQQEPHSDDAEILSQVIAAFNRLDPAVRERIYETVGTFFQLKRDAFVSAPTSAAAASGPLPARLPFVSDGREPSPKEFLFEKRPRTDVERVACLAYYVQHYRGQPHFSTLDISKLNTEAAQRKLTNAANSVGNAIKMGYLVPAAKGTKQISVPGERFVEMLPDYEAARSAMIAARPRRRANRNKNSKSED